MTDADRLAFARIMAGLGEIFGEAVSETRAEGYFMALKAYAVEEVEAMAASAIQRCRFFPRPADLIEQLEGSEADQAEAAWRQLERTLRGVGQYQSVRFADRALGEAVLAVWGGWIEANDDYHALEEPAWLAKRKEFLSAYRAAARRRRALPDRILAGRHEAGNMGTGFAEVAEAQRTAAILVGQDGKKALPA